MSSHEKAHLIDAPAESEQAYPSTAWAWYTVAILLCAYIFSFIDRQILNLLVAPVRRDLGITDTEMSLLIGFSFAVFYSVLGLPFGRLADSVSRPRLIIVGMFTWSLMTGGCGLINSYAQLFILRMGVGVGEATLSPAAYSMISDSFPPAKRSVPFSVYTMATYIGGGFAFLLGGLLLRYFGSRQMFELPLIGLVRPWQALFIFLGVSGILFILVLLSLRDPSRKGARVFENAQGKNKSRTDPAVSRLGIFPSEQESVALTQRGNGSRGAHQPIRNRSLGITFLVRNHHMTASHAGIVFGTAQIFAGTLGMLTAGKAVAWLAKRGYRDAYMRVAVFAAAAWLIPGILFPLVPQTNAMIPLLYVAIFFGCMPTCVIPAALIELVPNAMRGQATAFHLLVVNLIGLGIGPTAVALVTDKVFHYDAAVRYSLTIVPVAAIILAELFFVMGLRSYIPTLAHLQLWLKDNL